MSHNISFTTLPLRGSIDTRISGRLKDMWNYLQRWQVVNCLHQLQKKSGGVAWIEEYKLVAFIAGSDLNTSLDKESLFGRMRFRLSCFFFGVKTADDLFTKVKNLLYDCENVGWIVREKNTIHGISDFLNSTTRGREIYWYDHLVGIVFSNKYIEWVTKALIAYWLIHSLHITISP